MRPSDPRNSKVCGHLAANTGHVAIPALGVAEIEFGLASAPRPLSPAAAAAHSTIRKFFARHKQYAFDENSVEPYALIRAELWRMVATPKKKRAGFVEKHPEELKDRVFGLELEIDEKDLQIAAIAVQYRMVLATVDFNQRMQNIVAAAKALESAGLPIKLDIAEWDK